MQFDIIHLVRIYRPNIGGMETIVENIVKNQVNQGLKVCIVTTNFKREVISRDYTDNVLVVRLNHINFKNNLIPFEIPKSLSTNILHIHGMDIFVDFVSLFIKSNKKLLSPHGGFFHTKNLLFFKKIYFKTLSKLLYCRTNAYCISFNDVKLVKNITRSSNYMGCGFISREILAKKGKEAIIFGRIGKNKRVDLSIDFAKKYLPEVKINIIGHDEIGLMTNYADDEIINYFGVVEDDKFNIIIGNCIYFIFLSQYEGLGMSLIEALDMSLRCIVSDIDSFKIIYNQIKPELRDKFIYFIDSNNLIDYLDFQRWKNINISDNDRLLIRRNVRDIYSWKNVVKILRNEL